MYRDSRWCLRILKWTLLRGPGSACAGICTSDTRMCSPIHQETNGKIDVQVRRVMAGREKGARFIGSQRPFVSCELGTGEVLAGSGPGSWRAGSRSTGGDKAQPCGQGPGDEEPPELQVEQGGQRRGRGAPS